MVKEDSRIRKTKARLISTFGAMIEEKKFEDITINELCDKAGIRRATFYKHYQDKYDFLRFYVFNLKEDLNRFIWKNSKPEDITAYYIEYTKGVTRYLDSHVKLIINMSCSDILPILTEILREQNFIDTKERLQRIADRRIGSNANLNIVAATITGAVSYAIYIWYRGGKKTSEESVLRDVSSIIETVIYTNFRL